MSELEVDKWLHPGTLELHDNKDRNRQHHRLNKQRRTGNDCLQTVFRRFRHEMQDITHHHQDEHSFIAHHKLHKDLRMEIRENLKKEERNLIYKEYGIQALGKQNIETGEIDRSSLKLLKK